MRAHLLMTSVIPVLALLAAGCSPSGDAASTEAAAEAPAAEAAETVAAAEPTPAPAAEPVEVAEAQPAPAAAPAASSEDLEKAVAAVELRQAPMKLLGYNMGPLGGMLRGSVPFDAAVVETNTKRIASIAPMIPGVFVQDVRAFDVETEALSTIWDNKGEFDALVAPLVEAANAASTAAATGDEAATKAAMGQVGQACGACHDDFRED